MAVTQMSQVRMVQSFSSHKCQDRSLSGSNLSIVADFQMPQHPLSEEADALLSEQIPFRHYAQTHVAAAKDLLAEGGPQLRYACLELRLAIEALTYGTLQTYAGDDDRLVRSALSDWQPGKVLAALAEYDPVVEVSVRVVLREIEPDGDPGATVVDAVDRRFSARWAAEAHSSMGSFLHQRTIKAVRSGKQIDEVVLRRQAQKVLDVLEGILAAEVYHTRSTLRLSCDCPQCGHILDLAWSHLMLTGATEVRCTHCHSGWRAVTGAGQGGPRLSRIDAPDAEAM